MISRQLSAGLIKRILFTVVTLIIAFTDVHAHPIAHKNWLSDEHLSIQTSYQPGKVFTTNDFLSGLNSAGVPINRYQAVSVRVARQTTGTESWEQLYRYPRYGIGLFMADFRSKELGRPFSVYGFLTDAFIRVRNFSLTYDFAIGLSFLWNPYNPATNPYNIAISTPVNSMVEAGLGAEFKLFPRVSAGAELGFNHFSNGAIALPNLGVNCSFLKYNLRYELYSDDPIKPKKPVEKFKTANEWILAYYTGINESAVPVIVPPNQKKPYETVFALGVFGIYHRQLDYKSKIGAGIELGYIGLINPTYLTNDRGVYLSRKPDIRRFEISIFPSYELVIHKFSLLAEPGFYLYRNELIKYHPVFYQRVGLKYFFTDHLFASIHVRAHHFRYADLTEWTMGYKF